MTYVVEKSDPHAVYPHLTDEEFRCETPEDAGIRFADLSGQDERDSIAYMIEDERAEWTDPETGVEVIARRT